MSVRGFSVLVIDDDEDDFVIIRDYIDELFENCDISWQSRASDGLSYLYEHSPDICLLDINLGQMDGVELLKRAKSSGYVNPIIMLTGQDDIEVDKASLKHGAADFLVKDGLNSSRIWRAIRYALAAKEAGNERVERVRAQAESRAKSRFLANLSHEIRSPLTSIIGYSELLLQKPSQDDTSEKISIIHRNSIHLLNLINDVLDLSKIEVKKIDFSETEFDFERFLSSVYKSLSVIAHSKGLKLELKFLSKLPCKVIADITRLRQVLINIVNNAIKYTEIGSVTVSVGYSEHQGRARLHFSVADTGVGIEDDQREKIFEPFSQITPQGKASEGAGLGLTISRELIYALNGELTVDSKLGVGTTVEYFVEVILPQEPVFKHFQIVSMQGLAASTPLGVFKSLPAVNLLIVDDLEDVRGVLTSYADKIGITYCTATNGEEAINMIERDASINAVYMDIQMPVIDGNAAAEQIRALRPSIFMCALSASSSENNRTRSFQSGFDTFLPKPLNISVFHNTLEKHFIHTVTKSDTEGTELVSGSAIHRSIESEPLTSERRVLLIDDNEALNSVTTKLIEHCGWKVTSASSLEAARNCIGRSATSEYYYNLVLLDLNMPGAGPEEIVETVSNAQAAVSAETAPIVILSGSTPSSRVLAYPQVNEALLKPASLSVLKTLLERYS